MEELSSYAEGASLDPPEPPPAPAEGNVGNPAEPMPVAAPAPMDPPPVEESNPVDVPLEPAPTNASPTSPTEPAPDEPAPDEPAPDEPPSTEPPSTEPTSNGAEATPAGPAVDAADECAAMGGFMIAATGSCYRVGDATLTWQDARSFCEAWGGDLVAIGSAEENEALAQQIDGSAWIGATDQDRDGVFVWPGGETLDYVAWGLGQPNNLDGIEQCVELRAFDDQWSDVPCTDDFARQAFCERPPSM
jgi:hypothetical protein